MTLGVVGVTGWKITPLRKWAIWLCFFSSLRTTAKLDQAGFHTPDGRHVLAPSPSRRTVSSLCPGGPGPTSVATSSSSTACAHDINEEWLSVTSATARALDFPGRTASSKLAAHNPEDVQTSREYLDRIRGESSTNKEQKR